MKGGGGVRGQPGDPRGPRSRNTCGRHARRLGRKIGSQRHRETACVVASPAKGARRGGMWGAEAGGDRPVTHTSASPCQRGHSESDLSLAQLKELRAWQLPSQG